MELVYRKTVEGVAEVATRGGGLSARQRQALILVDGRRSERELRGLISQDADDPLAALLERGLIEPLEARRSATPPAAEPVRSAPDWQEQRRQLVRFLNENLGPSAEGLVMKIEKCRSLDELKPHLEIAEGFLRAARGPETAREFAKRFLDAPT